MSQDVEIPTMKSLFIEMRVGELIVATGTAFLIANDQQSHCTLITARHNVTGRHQETHECLSKTGAIPDSIVIYFHKSGETIGEWKPITLPLYRVDGKPWWHEHPTLGPKADVIALNLRWGDDVRRVPYYLKTDLDRGLVVGPAEPVSVIGFPFGLSSALRYPIWATGFLAQELSLVTPEHPVFLIDCRTRQGQSGAPVIAYRVGTYRLYTEGRISSSLNPNPRWEFLGIYTGRVNAESDLGRVWHVSVLEDLLVVANAAEIKKSDEAVGVVAKNS